METKQIKDYPLYRIREDGTVFSDVGHSRKKGYELKMGITRGYYVVVLRNGKGLKKQLVSRLVANTFISNPENKKEVNHINGNKLDNRVENLEWSTRSENMIHLHTILGKRSNMLGKSGYANNNSKEVIQISLDGFIINIFGSQREAGNSLGIPPSNINRVINNKLKTAGGFIWL